MLQVFRAPWPLSRWIDGSVLIRMGAGQCVSRFPAMPRAMLVMHLARREEGGVWSIVQPATFHALSTEPIEYAHADDIVAIGLIVRPAAAACLLVPARGALTNQAVPWCTIVGQAEAARLSNDTQAPDTELAALQALTASFARAMDGVAEARWQHTERLCEAVGQWGAQAGDRLGIGCRQLERRCRATLGVSPKRFERLERFHRALSGVVTQDAPSLAQASLDAGYCDQSHLGLEARQLGGASLREMKSQAAPGTPWWALSTPRALQAAPPSLSADAGA